MYLEERFGSIITISKISGGSENGDEYDVTYNVYLTKKLHHRLKLSSVIGVRERNIRDRYIKELTQWRPTFLHSKYQ
jgi:hypothetical protein